MPHQCVRCGSFYEDGSNEILKGCSCGGKLFFYIKKEKLEKLKQMVDTAKLSIEQKQQIEDDVFDLVGADKDRDEPVILDLESIRVKKPGQYEIDLVSLFKGDPVVVKLEDGKYMIDIVKTFKEMTDRAKENKK
jgi:predicted  nucleic acid-binding Zn-ribbon protein